MNEATVEIKRFTDSKGKDKFSCTAYGKYGEFNTQLEAAEFAEAAASLWRKKHEGS